MNESTTSKQTTIRSINKVPLLDGQYTGTIFGYSVTIKYQNMTTTFKVDHCIRDHCGCKVTILFGFADIYLK